MPLASGSHRYQQVAISSPSGDRSPESVRENDLLAGTPETDPRPSEHHDTASQTLRPFKRRVQEQQSTSPVSSSSASECPNEVPRHASGWNSTVRLECWSQMPHARTHPFGRLGRPVQAVVLPPAVLRIMESSACSTSRWVSARSPSVFYAPHSTLRPRKAPTRPQSTQIYSDSPSVPLPNMQHCSPYPTRREVERAGADRAPRSSSRGGGRRLFNAISCIILSIATLLLDFEGFLGPLHSTRLPVITATRLAEGSPLFAALRSPPPAPN